jgi:flavin reductase (DIM6/NTAB) family NADH-FMN oxidoreductase RutF
VDQESKKKSLRMITYGLYILTVKEGDVIGAGTVNWLSQASFTPPLVMVGVKADSQLHALISKTGRFAISILAHDQKNIASDFFRPTQMEGQKLNGHPYELSPTFQYPILTECPAWFEAKVTDSVAQGDHTIFVGEVQDAGVRESREPLVMHQTGWFYGG